jgi:sodium transport system permease protein
MLAVMWASLKKELREVMRDKRTLLLTILFPLGFYPAMQLITQDLQEKQTSKASNRVTVVGVAGWGDSASPSKLKLAILNLEWKPIELDEKEELLKSGEIDVFLDVKLSEVEGLPQRKVDIHYLGTMDGNLALLKVKEFLELIKDDEVRKRMEGKEYLLKPIEITNFIDHATALEVSGSMYGGVGAYLIVFLAFTGCMAVAIDTTAGEKERGTLESILATPAPFMAVACGKLLFIIMMGLISVLSTIGGIVIMVIGGGGDSGFSIAEVGFLSLLGITVLLIAIVLFFAAILFTSSILARSTKEAHVRGSMLMILMAMLLVYCIIPGVELTQSILWVPILNAAMSIKVLWGGSMPVLDYLLVVLMLLLFSALVLIWISKRVNTDREKVLLKQ